MSATFDPDAPAIGEGLFGLDPDPGGARFIVIPVPWDATTSYRDGTRNGPAAMLEASRQIDLYDLDFGRPWKQGISMLPLDGEPARSIARMNQKARKLAQPIIRAGGELGGSRKLARALAEVNRLGTLVNARVERATRYALERGRIPVILGGDHSTPFGAIRAAGARHPGLGILHIDAHADLREAYEGFTWSHASIMHNVVHRIGPAGGIATLVQVGIRDLGEREMAEIERPKRRGETHIKTFFDSHLWRATHRGENWAGLCASIVKELPRKIWLSIDIDGLDPTLCPGTGTPVPGGLSFPELVELLRTLAEKKHEVVGIDLNEVAPTPGSARRDWGSDWNANVGARVLYKLIGAAAAAAVTSSHGRRSSRFRRARDGQEPRS